MQKVKRIALLFSIFFILLIQYTTTTSSSWIIMTHCKSGLQMKRDKAVSRRQYTLVRTPDTNNVTFHLGITIQWSKCIWFLSTVGESAAIAGSPALMHFQRTSRFIAWIYLVTTARRKARSDLKKQRLISPLPVRQRVFYVAGRWEA